MYKTLLIIFLIVAITLVALIVLQQGKGASIGASFGGGISNTLFGSSGSTSFMTKLTIILATLFLLISLALSNINNSKTIDRGKWENINGLVGVNPTQLGKSTELINNTPQ